MNGKVDPSKFAAMKQRHLRRGMLNEWYGRTVAGVEMTAYGSRIRPIGELLDELGSKVFNAETNCRLKLEDAWEEVAGRQLATLTRVASFREGVLSLEVRHSAFLRELSGTTDLLLDQVNRFFGESCCREIRFVPSSGGSRRAWKKF